MNKPFNIAYLFIILGCYLGTSIDAKAQQLSTLICNDTIQVSLDANCQAILTPDILLASVEVGNRYQIFLTEPMDSIDNYQFNGTDSVLIEKVGFYKYAVVDTTNKSCWGYIRAEHKLRLSFSNLPRDTFVRCDVALTEAGIGASRPIVNNNCEEVELLFLLAYIEEQVFSCDTSTIITLWQAKDQKGNEVIDTQRTIIIRPLVDKLLYPEDLLLSCGSFELADIEDLKKTGSLRIQIGNIKNSIFIPTDTISLDGTTGHCNFAFTKTDVIEKDECQTEITRYWDIFDWCTPFSAPLRVDTQLIRIVDTLAPVFESNPYNNFLLPQRVELSENCRFEVPLITPIAKDNCDTIPMVEMFEVAQLVDGIWTKVGNHINLIDLPADTLRIGYKAFDKCPTQLKEDTTYTYVLTTDLIAPAIICSGNLVLSIGSGEHGVRLDAETVDGGSFDACGPIIKEIRLKGGDTIWNTSIQLPCEVVDSQLMVELRIRDIAGNQNFCWTSVRLEDKVTPVCQNLPAQTVSCEVIKGNDFGTSTDTNNNNAFDPSEWVVMSENQMVVFNEIFGFPPCMENISCKSFKIEQAYQRLDNGCGMGQLKRRYRGIDTQGNIGSWAEQVIQVNYEPNWTIIIAPDWEGECNETIPDPFINVQDGNCENLSINISEQTFPADEDYCLKVERTYQIINNCLFFPSTPPLTILRSVDSTDKVIDSLRINSDSLGSHSYFTYKQILKIKSTEKPILVINEVETCLSGLVNDTISPKADSIDQCAELRTFSAMGTDCIGQAITNYQWNFYENDILKVSGVGASFSIWVLPYIDYTVQFIAIDACNNSTEERKDFAFTDCVKPTLFSRAGITLELTDKMAGIWAADFDKGSYDNCTDKETLLENYRIWHRKLGQIPTNITEIKALPTNLTFTCADLAIQEVFIYIFDEADHYSMIETFVIIQDNQESCIRNNLATTAGKVINKNGASVEGVEVRLSGGIEAKGHTSETGNYQFEVTKGENYTVQPYKNDDPLNGVTTYDLILISKHILGIRPFLTPYEYIAADVNQSGTISTFDLVQLRQLILNVLPTFPNNQSWRFINRSFEFKTENPINEPFPERLEIKEVEKDQLMVDFIGVKIGDINGNAKTNTIEQNKGRSTSSRLEFLIKDQELIEGEEISIPFLIKEVSKLEGIQFALNFEHLELIELIPGLVTTQNLNTTLIQKGSLLTSWHRSFERNSSKQHLFTLTFKAKKSGVLSDFLVIKETIMSAEAYSSTLEELKVELAFTKSVLAQEFELFQNKPNPFHTETTISFYVPQQEKILFRLMDIQGRIVKEIEGYYQGGDHEIILYQDDFPSKGIFYYQLFAGNYKATRKMIIAD